MGSINESNVNDNLGLSAFVRQAIEFLKEYKTSNDRRMERVESDVRDIVKELSNFKFDSLKEDRDIELKVSEAVNALELRVNKVMEDIKIKVAEIVNEQKIKTVRWSLVGNVLTLLATALMFLLFNHFFNKP